MRRQWCVGREKTRAETRWDMIRAGFRKLAFTRAGPIAPLPATTTPSSQKRGRGGEKKRVLAQPRAAFETVYVCVSVYVYYDE